MLVTAKVAVVNQWCGPARMRDTYGIFHLIAGLEVTFDSERTVPADDPVNDCGGRAWILTDESRAVVARVLSKARVGNVICEHQLEIGD